MELPKNERRRFPRISGKIPVQYRVISSISSADFLNLEQKVFDSHSKDFSSNGLCIKTKEAIPPNTILEIAVLFPERKIKAIGRTIWSEETGPGEFNTGLEYVSIEESQVGAMAQSIAEYLIDNYKLDENKGLSGLKETLTHLFLKNK